MKSKQIYLFVVSFFLLATVNAQYKYTTNHDYMVKHQNIGKTGMIAYTTWSGVSLAAGVVGWATMNGEGKYFGQMNTLWGVINMGIALPGLLGSFKEIPNNYPTGDMIKRQYGSETTYLINGGLDFLYLGAGGILMSLADRYPKQQMRLKGYGESFLVNGGFLLLFDWIQYLRHRHQRVKSENLFLNNLSFSDNGIGVKYTFN